MNKAFVIVFGYFIFKIYKKNKIDRGRYLITFEQSHDETDEGLSVYDKGGTIAEGRRRRRVQCVVRAT